MGLESVDDRESTVFGASGALTAVKLPGDRRIRLAGLVGVPSGTPALNDRSTATTR